MYYVECLSIFLHFYREGKSVTVYSVTVLFESELFLALTETTLLTFCAYVVGFKMTKAVFLQRVFFVLY